MKSLIINILLSVLSLNAFIFSQDKKDDVKENWFIINKDDLAGGTHNTRHAEIFGKYVNGYNLEILKAIDTVQSKAMDGGGYFIGLNADPPESPISYDLKIFDKPLIKHTRPTSYCSGSTYAAFIEALNSILRGKAEKLTEDRYEALRMQEPDGGRREDYIKYWGIWNANGFGDDYAMVQYSKMGERVKPIELRPGDFLNISWKSGNGHSVIFLGWYIDEKGEKNIVYWASQQRTNGYGNDVVPISRIKDICAVRLTNPEAIFNFDVSAEVDYSVPGDEINWDLNH
jgi:hypothetical protein